MSLKEFLIVCHVGEGYKGIFEPESYTWQRLAIICIVVNGTSQPHLHKVWLYERDLAEEMLCATLILDALESFK